VTCDGDAVPRAKTSDTRLSPTEPAVFDGKKVPHVMVPDTTSRNRDVETERQLSNSSKAVKGRRRSYHTDGEGVGTRVDEVVAEVAVVPDAVIKSGGGSSKSGDGKDGGKRAMDSECNHTRDVDGGGEAEGRGGAVGLVRISRQPKRSIGEVAMANLSDDVIDSRHRRSSVTFHSPIVSGPAPIAEVPTRAQERLVAKAPRAVDHPVVFPISSLSSNPRNKSPPASFASFTSSLSSKTVTTKTPSPPTALHSSTAVALSSSTPSTQLSKGPRGGMSREVDTDCDLDLDSDDDEGDKDPPSTTSRPRARRTSAGSGVDPPSVPNPSTRAGSNLIPSSLVVGERAGRAVPTSAHRPVTVREDAQIRTEGRQHGRGKENDAPVNKRSSAGPRDSLLSTAIVGKGGVGKSVGRVPAVSTPLERTGAERNGYSGIAQSDEDDNVARISLQQKRVSVQSKNVDDTRGRYTDAVSENKKRPLSSSSTTGPEQSPALGLGISNARSLSASGKLNRRRVTSTPSRVTASTSETASKSAEYSTSSYALTSSLSFSLGDPCASPTTGGRGPVESQSPSW